LGEWKIGARTSSGPQNADKAQTLACKIGYCNDGRIALQIRWHGSNIFDVDHLVGSGNSAETTLRVRLLITVRYR